VRNKTNLKVALYPIGGAPLLFYRSIPHWESAGKLRAGYLYKVFTSIVICYSRY
jgi:hypothetical protein